MTKPTTIVCVLAVCAATILANGQEAPPESTGIKARGLWEQFDNSRSKSAKPTAAKSDSPRAGGRPSPTAQPQTPDAESLIGVTLWRVRSVQPGDEPFSVIALGGNLQGVPVRVPAGERLAEGERVRITIESSRSGYLYVIDREAYEDGTLGQPVLLFPTSRLHGGKNALAPGLVFSLPDLQDSPPVFTLTRSRPNHAGEALSVIITPEPIPEINVGRESQALPEALVAQWETNWGVKVAMIELPGSSGQKLSPAEQAAGTRTRELTHGDPLPQVLYQVAAKAGAPVLFHLELGIASRKP